MEFNFLSPLQYFIFSMYSVSAIKSFTSSMIVVFVRGLPIFPERIQKSHSVGSTSWIGDIRLALNESRLPRSTRLLIVSNDMLTLDNPDFFDSSSIIFLRVPDGTKVPAFFAFILALLEIVAHVVTSSFFSFHFLLLHFSLILLLYLPLFFNTSPFGSVVLAVMVFEMSINASDGLLKSEMTSLLLLGALKVVRALPIKGSALPDLLFFFNL